MSSLAARAAGAVTERPTLAAERRAEVRAWAPEAAWIGLGVFALDLAIGCYLNLQLNFTQGDALSRVASAYAVLFSRQPHLAAIGFIWNPLPSLLELPLVALRSLWPALAAHALAGVVVSAAFAGLGACFLVRILAGFGVPRAWRLALGALYSLNPLIVLYGANGMSDGMLVATLLGTLEGVLAYLDTGSLRGLTRGAVWLAVAFFVRYESVPFAVCLGLGTLAGLYGVSVRGVRIEGTLALLATPIGYAGGLWLYFNWLIMKNPLYFVDSQYGNASQTATGFYAASLPELAAAHHHLVQAVLYAARFTALFWPVVIGGLAVLPLLFGRRRDPRAPALLAPAIGLALFQAVLTYFGRSAGWDRFYIYYVPFGCLLVVLAAMRLARSGRARALTLAACVALFALGDAGTALALQSPLLGHGDSAAVQQILAGRPFPPAGDQPAIAAYVDAHPKLTVLLDSFTDFDVVLNARDPRQYVITSDLDFQSILLNPRGRVDAMLVPAPTAANPLAKLNAINVAYPGLWSGKLPWAHLIKQFPTGERLYAVGPGAP